MNILFLTDNFPPESNAPATRTYEHCLEWIQKGAKVTVITCAPNFPKGKVFAGYKNKLRQEEMMDGIRVIRVWSYISENRGMIRRTLDYLSYCIMAFFASLFVKTDVIIATSPQLFTAVAGYLASLFKRKPWIMEVRDLWPESIKAVEAMDESKVLKILDRLVLFLYTKANRIVVVTAAFKERIHACGVPLEKIHIVTNGVHAYKYQFNEKNDRLLQRLQLEGKFIVAYIGTHGMAHKLDFILDCAKEVKDPRIHFIFLGSGAMKGRLIQQAKRLKLTNVSLLDAVPKDKVKKYISIADVALITLRKSNTFKKVIPSKIFENAAMQKPILLGVQGEAQAIIEYYQAGLCFRPEDQNDFLEKLAAISKDEFLYRYFKKGCEDLAKDYDRKRLAGQMYDVIDELLHGEIAQASTSQRSQTGEGELVEN